MAFDYMGRRALTSDSRQISEGSGVFSRHKMTNAKK
jgi:hypothetical protein